MKLTVQKRLAGRILKASPKRITFDTERLDDIKESITKRDIRGLINDGAISAQHKKGVSRGRANERRRNRIKGRHKGHGSRKGSANSRLNAKQVWIAKIRLQRQLIRTLKENGLVEKKTGRDLYQKAKGGFFRSKKHLKLYIQEHNLIKNKAA